MIKQYIVLTSAVLFALLSQTASAEFYLSASKTFSSVDFDNAVNPDEDANGYSLHLGFVFNPYVAIQAGYADIGKFEYNNSYTVVDDGDNQLRVEGATISVEGPEVSLLLNYPFTNNFSVYGELGAYRLESTPRIQFSGSEADNIDIDFDAQSQKDEEFFYAIGAEYRFNEKFSLTAERSIYEYGSENGTIEQLGLGVKYRF